MVNGVIGMRTGLYDRQNSSGNVRGTGSFADEVQKAEKKQNMAGTDTPLWKGDMVISQPPNYYGFTYDRSISDKTKEEMTMDEYKQWFMNEMSQMPVSGWYRSTCAGGSLVITDKAFERMKSDPEWESTAMNMIRKMYSTNGIMGSKMIGFQVIGASPEECYGEGIPVNSGVHSGSLAGDGESWWRKRHDRMEELIEYWCRQRVRRAE